MRHLSLIAVLAALVVSAMSGTIVWADTIVWGDSASASGDQIVWGD